MSWNISFLLRAFFIILATYVLLGKGVILDCYMTRPREYDGHQQTTETGEACVRWDIFNYKDGDFPDATVSDAANYCRKPSSSFGYLGCLTNTSGYEYCGIKPCTDDSLTKCGQLTIEQPTILGRNVTFIFTPDTNTSNSIVEWQRKNGDNTWSTLPIKYNFTQYSQDWTNYLILTDTVLGDEEMIYRVHYYNESMHCLMETPKLDLEEISSSPCGFVYLRTEKIKENEKVEIEYYPSKYVMENPENFERQWALFRNEFPARIEMKADVYKEEKGPNDKYVLTIIKMHENITGQYRVYCGGSESERKYSDDVTVEIPVAPSAPVFEGLKDIEDCEGCIVGKEGDQFSVACKTSGGTKPVKVSMSMGQIPLITNPYNQTGTSYMAFLDLRDSHHMLLMTCSVMNEALTSPLTAVARVYVIKSPILQSFTVPESLKEGDDVNITCIFSGGRPAPNVFLTISGTEVSSANQTSDRNSSTQIAHLATFERRWNKENITCCRYSEWYNLTNLCSPPKRVNYLFPPSDIKLEIKVEKEVPHKVYAVCTVYDSNPVCELNISAPGGIIASERYNNSKERSYVAWNTELAVNLNVSKDDNGKEIECSAYCPDFNVSMKDNRSVLVPYVPVIEFNISGTVLNMSEGGHTYIRCSAQSFPASNISWAEQSGGDVTIMKQCPLKTNCIITIEASRISQRHLVCQALYLKKNVSKVLTVNIFEKDEQRYTDQSTGDKSLIWIILGCCLVVLIVVFIVCVVARKKRRKKKAKPEAEVKFSADGASREKEDVAEDPLPANSNVAANSCDKSEVIYSQPDKSKASACANETYSVVHKTGNQNPSASGSKEVKAEDPVPGNATVAANSCDQSEVIYSQPDKSKASAGANETYSVVHKTGNQNPSASGSKEVKAERGQLLYADLDFDTSVGASKTDVVKRRNSPTEYVAIDFVKTAEHEENETAQAENIYANQ